MEELNEINKKEDCVCRESESVCKKLTIEDELHWAKIRIEELREELNAKEKRIDEEQKKNCVLVDCLSTEHNERKNAFREIEYAYRRVDRYRNAICEIGELCTKTLKGNEKSGVIGKGVIKDIFNIVNKF